MTKQIASNTIWKHTPKETIKGRCKKANECKNHNQRTAKQLSQLFKIANQNSFSIEVDEILFLHIIQNCSNGLARCAR
jgi:hypothetical protein